MLYTFCIQMRMSKADILKRLTRLGQELRASQEVEITVVGAAAGMLTGDFGPGRSTVDCDVIRYDPAEVRELVETTAGQVAARERWNTDWFNSRVMELDVLPAGWRSRRRLIGRFGVLTVYALGRLDLLATKFFASRPQDRDDIRDLNPTAEELYSVGRYLEQMRLPSRGAHLDDLERAMTYFRVVEKRMHGK